MLASIKDVVDAHDAGRVHVQRYLKNAGAIGDGQWQDWSYASGQPAYDARIGGAGAFTPFVASRNDAVFFPPIPAGMERRIDRISYTTVAGGASQVSVEMMLYDLIGVYPLIDGDSVDVQELSNSLAFPRNSNGEGLRAVLVNHVAPSLGNAAANIVYTNTQGIQHGVVWNVGTFGQNKVCYASTLNSPAGPLFCELANGDTGIRSIDSLQFQSAPGGIWAIYIVKPLFSFCDRSDPLKIAGEKHLTFQNAFQMPLVPDGAWLGMFYMPNGGGRTVAMFGEISFIWG